MGRLDEETKAFMSDPRHFADAFNYLIYDGQPVIDPNALRPMDSTEIAIPYGGGIRAPAQKFRDVLKLLCIKRDDEAIYAVLGVENQTKVHYAMPVRDMLYDALNYTQQVEAARKAHGGGKMTGEEFLSGFRKQDRLMPVITLVIYFGSDQWDGPMSIHEMLQTPNQRLTRFVPDYRINLIAPMLVPDEDFEKFSTDFRDVMQYIKCSRDEKKLLRLVEGNERFASMNRDAAELINLATNSKMQFHEEGDRINMCEAIKQLTQRSEEKGRVEGRVQGRVEGVEIGGFKMLDALIREHYLTLEQAAAFAGMAKEKLLEALDAIEDQISTPNADLNRFPWGIYRKTLSL